MVALRGLEPGRTVAGVLASLAELELVSRNDYLRGSCRARRHAWLVPGTGEEFGRRADRLLYRLRFPAEFAFGLAVVQR
jgi:hypothetical protein